MRLQFRNFVRTALPTVLFATAVWSFTAYSAAQNNPSERTFSQSKTAIEKAIKAIRSNLSGRLPVVDGFAKAGEQALAAYSRGYYQATVEVASTATGGSTVRITTKVTAWYSDPAGSHSGYQLLNSNGRIESDLLDQLADQLAGASSASEVTAASKLPAASEVSVEPSAPSAVHKFPEGGKTLSATLSRDLASATPHSETHHEDHATEASRTKKAADPLQAEVDSLEEILKNTGHPKNLVAVKKSGTPVVPAPSLNAKPQFLASMHDEFELLDFNADWVHVKISGLSRGWIWRSSVEMPDGIPDTEDHPGAALAPSTDLFHVVREETAQFPGDWEPLRSKLVKILSVQKADGSLKDAAPQDRMEFAKFLLEKTYKEMAQKSQDLQGVVLIFDSSDGGMIAATTSTLQQWTTGSLSDAALWHKCFFDPPETFDAATPAGAK